MNSGTAGRPARSDKKADLFSQDNVQLSLMREASGSMGVRGTSPFRLKGAGLFYGILVQLQSVSTVPITALALVRAL